ncbi:M48 family metallopeptidase [Roseofilum sp. BLCC_M154]|uniref:M48 family metallopeptidase n=1 Tax=Roseofilum acuticapitatum BLCC-M154 TaxID=3022444 RepID=A0ABT7ANU4_9CYAN|nr:M48 family metallopeptidase [Roseofilum acuticapitatum]MDJ1168564.1 M48 family metallopeptidase [Roseofilum acuticapitatum BLCC-M154]
MNFFEHQEQARRKTVYLIFLFAIAIMGMILALYSVVAIITYMELQTRRSLISPELLILITIGVLLVVGFGSGHKILQLRSGGKIVAFSLGGRLVQPNTTDLLEQRLLNVVEEMAIASGTSIPPVYLLDHEPGINAFAAGFTINDAVIGVTKGCLQELSRDQLQGVIAHEFSHIIYGDMRLNLYLIGIVQGILLIHILGRTMLRLISDGPTVKRKKQGLLVIAGLALLGIGYIGFLCGRMIKSAISRQREFLADASAVQFTRNPLGLSGALRTIGNLKDGSKIKTPTAEEASHLFFGEAIRNFNHRFFATHPPLSERIERLENLPVGTLSEDISPPERQLTATLETPEISQLQSTTIHANPESIITEIGTTDRAHLNYAQSLLFQLPEAIKTALKSEPGSQALIYGLLLNTKDKTIQERQISHLRATESPELLDHLWQIFPYFQDLNPRYRLPLIDLTIPILRNLSIDSYQHLSQQVQTLIDADGKLSLSEYTLQVILLHRLAPYFHPTRNPKTLSTTLPEIWNDCLVILSGLAKVGHPDEQQAIQALRSGLQQFPDGPKKTLPDRLIPTNIISIRRSLRRLMNTTPKLKQAIVEGCAHTVLFNHQVNIKEAELLRTVIILLDCPIPPFLETL